MINKSIKNYFYPYFLLTGFLVTLVVLSGTLYHLNKVEKQATLNILNLKKEVFLKNINFQTIQSLPVYNEFNGVKWQLKLNNEGVNSELLYREDNVFKSFLLEETFNGKKLVLVLSAPVHLLIPESQWFAWRLIFTLLFISILLVFLSWRLGKNLGLPIVALNAKALKMAEGDLTNLTKVPHRELKEIRELSSSMNKLASRLNRKIKELKNRNNEQEALFSSMSEGVFAIDSHFKVRLCNDRAKALLSLATPSYGKTLYEVIRKTELVDFIEQYVSHGKIDEYEFEVKRGQFLKVKAGALKTTKGNVTGAVFVFSDQTAARSIEKQRKHFVSNVSHELRTPLTLIQGFVETLLDPEVKDISDIKNYLNIISRHTIRLKTVIEDILMLSKLESDQPFGKNDLQLASLKPVVNAVVELENQKAKKQGIQITVLGDVSTKLYIHPTLLEQAILNLLENAIRYGSSGKKIEILLSEANDEVTLTVKDYGQGLEEKHLSRLFERFYIVNKGRTRSEGGSGLGLSIVKHIALLHRGRVEVKSQVGRGSEFSIMIPKERT